MTTERWMEIVPEIQEKMAALSEIAKREGIFLSMAAAEDGYWTAHTSCECGTSYGATHLDGELDITVRMEKDTRLLRRDS